MAEKGDRSRLQLPRLKRATDPEAVIEVEEPHSVGATDWYAASWAISARRSRRGTPVEAAPNAGEKITADRVPAESALSSSSSSRWSATARMVRSTGSSMSESEGLAGRPASRDGRG
jgi:hypothetical protein